MTTKEIDEAVAKATGEDVRTIAWLGFVLLVEPTANNDASHAPDPVVSEEIDWNDIDLERYLAMCG